MQILQTRPSGGMPSWAVSQCDPPRRPLIKCITSCVEKCGIGSGRGAGCGEWRPHGATGDPTVGPPTSELVTPHGGTGVPTVGGAHK